MLSKWGREGVLGWFSSSDSEEAFRDAEKGPLEGLAMLLGAASATEVVAMNALTINLHLMLVAFYRPTQERYKIIVEEDAFPSDMVLCYRLYAPVCQWDMPKSLTTSRHAALTTPYGSTPSNPISQWCSPTTPPAATPSWCFPGGRARRRGGRRTCFGSSRSMQRKRRLSS